MIHLFLNLCSSFHLFFHLKMIRNCHHFSALKCFKMETQKHEVLGLQSYPLVLRVPVLLKFFKKTKKLTI